MIEKFFRVIAGIAAIGLLLPVGSQIAVGVGGDQPVTRDQLIGLSFGAAFFLLLGWTLVQLMRLATHTRTTSAVPAQGIARLSQIVTENLPERAMHEAGHAVVAHRLGKELLSVSTRSNPSLGSGGMATYAHSARDLASVEDEVAISLAGSIAAFTPTDGMHGGPHDDYASAMRCALVVTAQTGKPVEAVLSEAMERARKILEEDRPGLLRLASELAQVPKTIDGQEAVDIIEGRV